MTTDPNSYHPQAGHRIRRKNVFTATPVVYSVIHVDGDDMMIRLADGSPQVWVNWPAYAWERVPDLLPELWSIVVRNDAGQVYMTSSWSNATAARKQAERTMSGEYLYLLRVWGDDDGVHVERVDL